MSSVLNANSSSGSSPPVASEPLSVYGPRPLVTRISRRAVVVLGIAAAGLTLLVLMMSSGGRSTPDRQAAQPPESDIRASGPVESVRELPTDYTYQPSQTAQTSGGITSATRPVSGVATDAIAAEQLRQLARMRQELTDRDEKDAQQANDSPLVFAKIRSAAMAPGSTTPATARPQSPAPGGPGLAVPMPPGAGEPAAGSRGDARHVFLTQAASVEPYLHESLLRPIFSYELKAGSVVPAALLTAINTDLPGDIIAQVTENVYDSASGDYLLIPQGSRLLGTYHSLVNNGQNRALLVWQRLIYPNGDSITLGGMPGTDEAGTAGVADQVDYHLDKLAGATALSTAIAYGGNLARNRQGFSSGYSNEDVIGDTVAQQADRVGSRIIDRQLDVQPTITVRQGWPLRVLVNKDIVLKPYRPN